MRPKNESIGAVSEVDRLRSRREWAEYQDRRKCRWFCRDGRSGETTDTDAVAVQQRQSVGESVADLQPDLTRQQRLRVERAAAQRCAGFAPYDDQSVGKANA